MPGPDTLPVIASEQRMSNPILMRFRIPLLGLKTSTNKIYAGEHWSKRKHLKDSVLSVAGYFCRPAKRIESYPIEIRYRFLFGTRALDTLNTAYMAKMFEDALRTLGILEDDDPKYVARSVLEVDAWPRPKRPQESDASWPKANAQDKDWLELTITSCST